jgi:glycosyltransferase involved in cell wall biosynthesis
MKVSVIIPVYKVEDYAERCARSLMEQTFPDIEFIFVDDCSPDASMDIIRRVCSQYRREVRFLAHSENRGLPAARNTGLRSCTGEWILHCDSDDWLEPTMVERLCDAAMKTGADLAYCDYYLDFGGSRRRLGNPDFRDGVTMVREGYFGGTAKYNVWNKLARASLFSGICFPEGHAMGEDMTMIPVTARASRVVHVPEALYHYFKLNPGAYSSSFSAKNLEDILFNVNRALESVRDYPFSEKDTAFFKLGVKLPFLMSGSREQFRLWKEWFPEADRYINENHYLPLRTRTVQQFAAHNLFFLVRLYCFAVDRIYYGIHRLFR